MLTEDDRERVYEEERIRSEARAHAEKRTKQSNIGWGTVLLCFLRTCAVVSVVGSISSPMRASDTPATPARPTAPAPRPTPYFDAVALGGMPMAKALSTLKNTNVWTFVAYNKKDGGINLKAKDGTDGFAAIYNDKVIWVQLSIPRSLPKDRSTLAQMAIYDAPGPDQTWPNGTRWTSGFGPFTKVEIVVGAQTLINAFFVPEAVKKQWERQN